MNRKHAGLVGIASLIFGIAGFGLGLFGEFSELEIEPKIDQDGGTGHDVIFSDGENTKQDGQEGNDVLIVTTDGSI